MIRGIFHFLQAASFLMGTEARRRWLMKQFWRALLLGLVLLILVFALLGWGFTALWSTFQLESYAAWAAGAGLIILWGALFIFGAGPIALLGASLYLSERANWKGLNSASAMAFVEASSSMQHSFWKSLGLMLLILICLPLSLVPFLAWINVLVAAFALGQEWVWAAEERYGRSEKTRGPFYKIGIGIIPALVAAIPIVGVLSLPFLQTAALWIYRQSSKGEL